MEFYKGVQEPATSQIWLYPIEDGNFECRVYGSKGWKPVTTEGASADYRKAITDILITKADHGYPSNPKSLKQVEDLKENSENKQNSLNTDGTGTKFPTVDAVNSGLASVGNNLIASVTVSGNLEIPVDSVDMASNTFTRANHGLQNGNIIFPTLNWSAGATFPLAVFTGGLNFGRYYVINSTTNTFQLSLTSGGSSIALSTNATQDLLKWHFEKGVTGIISISGLNAEKYRAIFKGKISGISAFYPFTINGITSNFTWDTRYSNSFILSNGGTIFCFLEGILSCSPYLSIDVRGTMVNSSTTTANSVTRIGELKASMNNSFTKINTVNTEITGQFFANGSTLEIYKI